MTDANALLDAHVRFELDRWSGAGLDESVRSEVRAAFDWLETVALREVAPATEIVRAATAAADALPVTDEVVRLVAEVAASAHRAIAEALGDDRVVGDVVHREELDALVSLVAGMEEVRRELLDAVTASEAYVRLVSHVLYHGLKGFVLTDNVLARKIPGASSLVKMGQRRLSNAAPNLEANLDRQLTSFVQANIGETLRESRRYLETMFDEELLADMAAETWNGLEGRSVASLVDLLQAEDVESLVSVTGPVLQRMRETGMLGKLVGVVLTEALHTHADQPVGELLDELGLSDDRVATDLTALLRPAVEHAAATGFLESRIRAGLEPFYRALPDLVPGITA